MLSCFRKKARMGATRQPEAPVNGGRNYRTDHCSYVNKSGYMLGSLEDLNVLADSVGSNKR